MTILGIGVDIISNQRILQIITSTRKERFLHKVLHPLEIQTFNKKSTIEAQTQFQASRWAAKEAIVKATQQRHLIFPDISVLSQNSGIFPLNQLKPNIKKANQRQYFITPILKFQKNYTIKPTKFLLQFRMKLITQYLSYLSKKPNPNLQKNRIQFKVLQ